MKSDVSKEVGVHVFERAGLGVAPFKYAGYEYKVFKAAPEAPSLPGGLCSYCGAALYNCCYVKDVNGGSFIVGPDCIEKVGERGIIKAFKSSPEFRKHKAEIRKEKASKIKAELDAALVEKAEALKSAPHPKGFKDWKSGNPLSFYDYAVWMVRNAGASGRERVYREMKKVVY